jgi:hypothetical protein
MTPFVFSAGMTTVIPLPRSHNKKDGHFADCSLKVILIFHERRDLGSSDLSWNKSFKGLPTYLETRALFPSSVS